MKNLTIVGGGFAGVWAAMSAAAERNHLKISPEELEIKLINMNGDLIIRPRLYEGAKEDMKVSLKPLLKVINVRFTEGLVRGVNPSKNLINLKASEGIQDHIYDRLILASGSQIRDLPIPGSNQFSFNMDTFANTVRLDKHLADQYAVNKKSDAKFTVVVVGGSFTGIEAATELRTRFGDGIRIVLLDHDTEIGRELGKNLRPEITNALSKCKIETYLDRTILEIDKNGITLDSGEIIETETVILATGMEASPLTRLFDAQKDKTGRLIVNSTLQIPSNNSLFVAGDTAFAMADADHPTYMSCQHAMEMGRYAGHNAIRNILGKPMLPYSQETYRTCLDLGPVGAVFTEGWDRKVSKTGDEGKAIKQQINREWIYPPAPTASPESIFEAVGLSQQ